MVNHEAGIYVKKVDTNLYDVFLRYAGGLVMVCYEVECSNTDRLVTRVENLHFTTSTRTQGWLFEHCDFVQAVETSIQPRF